MNNQEQYQLEESFRQFARKVNNPNFSFSDGAINRLIKWVSCGVVDTTAKKAVGNESEAQKNITKIIQDNKRHNEYKNRN